MAKNLFSLCSETVTDIFLHCSPIPSPTMRLHHPSAEEKTRTGAFLGKSNIDRTPNTRAASLSFLESRPPFRDYPNLPGRAPKRRSESRSNHNPDPNVFGLGTVLKQLQLLSATFFFFLCCAAVCLFSFRRSLQENYGREAHRSNRPPSPFSHRHDSHFSSKKGFAEWEGDSGVVGIRI